MKNYLFILFMLVTGNVMCQGIDSIKIVTYEHLWRFSINPVTGDSVSEYCDNSDEIFFLEYLKNKKKFKSSYYTSRTYKTIVSSGEYVNIDSINAQVDYKQFVYEDSIMKLLDVFKSDKNRVRYFKLEFEPHRRKTITIKFYTKKGIVAFSKMISSNGASVWYAAEDNNYESNEIERTIETFVPDKFIQYKLK